MEWIELGDLVDIRKGTRILETKGYENAIRRIMIGDLRNNKDIRYTIQNEKNVLVNPEDIIIAWDGANAGLIGYGVSGAIGSTLARLRLKNKEMNSSYLGLYLGSKFKEISYNCTGATIPHVNRNHLIKMQIPNPPINIQKKIVELLDEAQSLIDNRKKQIKLLDDLIESVFYDMFGDPISNTKNTPEVQLEEICNLKAGKFIRASEISDLWMDNMYPCYGGNGVRGYVTEYTHEGAYPLIGRQGALCGNVNFAKEKFYATEHAIVVQPIVELDIYWLYIMLNKMNLNRFASGAAQPGLNVGTLKKLKVMHPPIKNQIEFGKKYKEIKKLKEIMGKSLVEIENNYKSLMQKAFKGELF